MLSIFGMVLIFSCSNQNVPIEASPLLPRDSASICIDTFQLDILPLNHDRTVLEAYRFLRIKAFQDTVGVATILIKSAVERTLSQKWVIHRDPKTGFGYDSVLSVKEQVLPEQTLDSLKGLLGSIGFWRSNSAIDDSVDVVDGNWIHAECYLKNEGFFYRPYLLYEKPEIRELEENSAFK